MMNERNCTVISVVRDQFEATSVVDDGDMHLRRALPNEAQLSLGPFVFIDHYRHHSRRGIGDRPHPHAGIEVVSYLLKGGVEHRDSMGFRDHLGAGDAQFIRAGRGVLHAEQPDGGRHGLQLWTSLPPELKLSEPTYRSFRAAELPTIFDGESLLVVVAGHVNKLDGPMSLSGNAVFARLQVNAGASKNVTYSDALEMGIYVLQGSVELDGAVLATGTLGLLGKGNEVRINALGDQVAELALLGGAPVQGEVLLSGPFVMDTPERLAQARRDFASGRMGRMEGVPF